MESILIIGGNGFIGKNLIEFFVNDYQITVADKYIDEKFFCKFPQVNVIKMDLVQEMLPTEFSTPNYIINLASIVTAERDLSLFDELINSNLKILLNLYERFKDNHELRLFIQFGSIEEYGNNIVPFTETMREYPNSPYALAKQITVNTALMLYSNYNFPIMAVRPGNLFGKYQNIKKFIPYIISNLKENKIIDVTFCEQKRDFIYALDFAWCIGQIIKNYKDAIGQIVNISCGNSISLKDIIETCKLYTCSKSPINYGAIPYRENETMDLNCSVNKLSDIIKKDINFDIKNRLKEYINTL